VTALWCRAGRGDGSFGGRDHRRVRGGRVVTFGCGQSGSGARPVDGGTVPWWCDDGGSRQRGGSRAVAYRGSEYCSGQWPERGGDFGRRRVGDCGGGSVGAARATRASAGGVACLSFATDGAHARTVLAATGRSLSRTPADGVGVQPHRAVCRSWVWVAAVLG